VHANELNDTLTNYINGEVAAYSNQLVKDDWNTQSEKKVRNTRLQELRQHLYTFHPEKQSEQRVLDIIDDLIDDAIDLRHERVANNQSHIPGLVWVILWIGTSIVVICSYLFSVNPAWLHFFYVMLLAGLISMCLFLIYVLDHPFQGSSHVSNLPFRELLDF
jgi:ABC-type multidrug transport system permease subunit